MRKQIGLKDVKGLYRRDYYLLNDRFCGNFAKKRMKKSLCLIWLGCLLAGVLAWSCSRVGSVHEAATNDINVRVDTLVIPSDSDYLTLSAYTITSAHTDSASLIALASNTKIPSIDRIDISRSKVLSPIFIDMEGPDGIPGYIFWIEQISPDSIFVCDEIKLYLLDDAGRVKKSFYMNDGVMTFATRNTRMHSTELHYNRMTDEVMYPINDSDVLKIEARNMTTGKLREVCILPGFTGKRYGFKVYPNVAITDSVVVWNYPYEQKINVRRLDGQGGVATTECLMTLMTAECKQLGNTPSIEELSWHSYESPHFTELHFMPELNLYGQIVVGPTIATDRSDEEYAATNRPVYLRLFNSQLKPIMEMDLRVEATNIANPWFFAGDALYRYLETDNPEGITLVKYSFE